MASHAEWKSYDNNNTDTDVFYIDYSRIKTEGRYKSMWYLDDTKSPKTDSSGKQFKSSVTKSIIDCQGSRLQTVAIYRYSEQMGNGEVILSNSRPLEESQWIFPPPGSIFDGHITIACGSK